MIKDPVISAQSLVAALFRSVSQGNPSECERLIQQGAYPDGRDEQGNSLLKIVVSLPNRLKLSRALLKAGAAVEGTNLFGETPLISAALGGECKCRKAFVGIRGKS